MIISDAFSYSENMHFHIEKMYKDKEIKENVKDNFFLSMCDVKIKYTIQVLS
jgi:hypothetical protein